MTRDKPRKVEVAKRFDRDFFDGARDVGYGGYYYDGRWKSVARQLIETYGLDRDSRVLDIGCGKGFLLRDLCEACSGMTVYGADVSAYAIEHGEASVKGSLFVHDARRPFDFTDGFFDLVISINTLHNLYLPELCAALTEVQRIGRNGYVVVESYRNEQEKFNLMCWNLTGECVFTPEEWLWVFKQAGYTGDYEFIFFE